MSERATIPDTVHEKAQEIAEEKDTNLKEAIRMMCRSGEQFDV